MADVKLFGRKIRVVVSTIEITELTMLFNVVKTLKPEPNKAELTIYNLNPSNRSKLEQMVQAPVQIEAGYQDGMSVLFLGDLRTAITIHQGPDYITKLSSGDGERAVKTARVNVSLKKGSAGADKVLEAVAKSLGVGDGNLKQALNAIKAAGLADLFSEGTVIFGSAFREMTTICHSLGLTWSIQDGKLQILEKKKALEGQAIKINERTGLIGSPTVDNKGVLTCQTLLIPDVFPGRLMVLESERIQGQYRIESCQYTGDTRGQDWYIQIEGKRY